jgi:hypothetical protein
MLMRGILGKETVRISSKFLHEAEDWYLQPMNLAEVFFSEALRKSGRTQRLALANSRFQHLREYEARGFG